NEYLPPDSGITEREALGQMIELLDRPDAGKGESKRLLNLAERVAALEGPSRKIDVLIWLVVFEKPQGRRGRDMIGCEPYYTRDRDAAASLIPDDHGWSVSFDNGTALAGCCPANEEGCWLQDVEGLTPALALT